ncbi:MAG: O-succinylbenzoate synthase [Candidatus Dormibacteraeota bacterium]|nr:O-succinylbenzoate synthase [Candidatus Dormibacteraeota bacterium]
MRRIAFTVPLRVPVMGISERSGWLVEGDAGWGECSPLPSWSAEEARAAGAAAAEAASEAFPAPRSERIAVNAMVPRLAADVAAQLAVESRCRAVKVKVGDDAGIDRVAAVRSACGPAVRIRVDANGAWDLDTALRELTRLAVYDVELAEDPVARLEDLTMLRRRSQIPLAAEMSIRTVADAKRLRELGAADVIVLKPQRIGGVRAALDAAAASGVFAIASSALETSVGLAAVAALAAALGEMPFAHGCGTALLLERDVTDEPLVPEGGWLTPRRVAPSAAAVAHG